MLEQDDSSQNLPKVGRIIIKIVSILGMYCKYLTPVQEFSLKNDTLKNIMSCAAQNSLSAPSPGISLTGTLILYRITSTTQNYISCVNEKIMSTVKAID